MTEIEPVIFGWSKKSPIPEVEKKVEEGERARQKLGETREGGREGETCLYIFQPRLLSHQIARETTGSSPL